MHHIWEELFRTRAWGKYPPEHLIRFVMQSLGNRPDRRSVRILEIGCGAGANLWFMANEGFSVTGIDGAPSAIDQASHLCRAMVLNGNQPALCVGDFCRTLPWDSGSFDLVIDNVSLCTNPLADVRHGLEEVHRVLKPAGRLYSCWFTPETWGYGTGREDEPDGFSEMSEGPLHDRGFALFLRPQRVADLFQSFCVESTEQYCWTLENQTQRISELCIAARKREPVLHS